ncbi:hypothetical protein [uncultured Nostoc sp.]|uniref:hypothetical protein n=1 Tax=uncultured Nostoc sp. TaxID=340711 RepID=UPI0035CAD79D
MSETTKEESRENHKRGIPLYIDQSEPKINDPALSESYTGWRGSNEISFKLLQCLEAMRDLSKIMESLANFDDHNADQRLVKQLSSPLYAMVGGILDMFNELESNAKNYTLLASPQHKEIINKKKQFILDVIDNQSNLRIVRDKIDSHIDKQAVIKPQDYWSKVDICDFLKLMGGCLEQIFYLLSLNVYGWTRESGHPDI